jgi:hypothetical protein
VENRSTESSALDAERHTRKIFLQALSLGAVGRFGEAANQQEKPFLLGFFGLQAGLDQVDEYALGARFSRPGQRTHAPRDTGRNRHALTDSSVCSNDSLCLHHDAPVCSSHGSGAGRRLVRGPKVQNQPNPPFQARVIGVFFGSLMGPMKTRQGPPLDDDCGNGRES